MKARSSRSILTALMFFPCLPHSGGGQEFQVDLDGENRVTFVSDAPLEDFQGVTDRIDGFVFLPDVPSAEGPIPGSEFYFEVDLASLDTGIGLRNRHMRENYLETGTFPFATYSGGVRSIRVQGDGSFSVVVNGVLAIHGVERERDIACLAEPGREDSGAERGGVAKGPLADHSSFSVRCSFQVSLSDHDIPIPSLMFMKIDEVMELELAFQLERIPSEER